MIITLTMYKQVSAATAWINPSAFRPEFFSSRLTNPPTVIFQKVEKKSKIIFFKFYPLTLNIVCIVEKNNMFSRFCLCIFESDTVKSDCPMQENYEIFKDFSQTVGLLY